ncbi:MAG: nicotinate phosphoribosyltransferase [Alphaproteobacteria bacterium]|nr:nicotinate phosphoribosyltransferase [Alphaproteobacteria bacterium]MCY4319392.1 nicotinate phosphoribosyltransferase [Alphaproteobacteria bacterium]
MDGALPHPAAADVPHYTDAYFSKSKAVVERFGDVSVTYAVFMRRPVVSAARLTVEWLNAVALARGVIFDIEERYAEGVWVGAGDPLLYISGPLRHLIDLETLYLQKLGSACVAAYNARAMCMALPKAGFLAMDARHCAGTDMAELMAYAASVGSTAAKREVGAVGFIGNATNATAHFFGADRGLGTMPHGLIGYAGSTLRAAEMFAETFPEELLTVVTDYYGAETSDAVAVCRRFPEQAAAGRVAIRLDTHGGRYAEGLDLQKSYEVLDRNAPRAIRDYRTEGELRHLVGTGVTAAAIWHLRETLDAAGFPEVKITASSGFTAGKCRVMALAQAPVDTIGTGSYLPDHWPETYATADIVEYGGKPSVKVGREFLLRRR